MNNLDKFLEAVSGKPLPAWQRDMLAVLVKAKAEGRKVVLMPARRNGRAVTAEALRGTTWP